MIRCSFWQLWVTNCSNRLIRVIKTPICPKRYNRVRLRASIVLCRLKWYSKHPFLTQPLIRKLIIRVRIKRRESMVTSLLILNKIRNCVWRKPVLPRILLLPQLLHLDLQKHQLILRDLVTKSFRISLSRKSSKRLIFAPKSSSLNWSPEHRLSAYRKVC